MLSLVALINTLIGLYSLCVIAWLILTTLISFNVVNRTQRVVMVSMYYLNRLCGPPMRHIRKFLPNTGQIDFAPIVLLLLLDFARTLLITLAMGQSPVIAVVFLIARVIELFIYCLIAQMIVSLLIAFNIVNRYQPFVSAVSYSLEQLTEPALAPIRKILPPFGVLDLAPLALILALGFLKNMLFNMAF